MGSIEWVKPGGPSITPTMTPEFGLIDMIHRKRHPVKGICTSWTKFRQIATQLILYYV